MKQKKKQKKWQNSELRTLVGAVDIGGTKIASALFSRSGQRLFASRVQIAGSGGKEVLEQVISICYQLLAEAEKRRSCLVAIGLCVPGVVDPGTGFVWAPNIKGWKNFQLMKRLKKVIPCRLTVISDRTAYVLGESWKGAARNKKNVVYLAVGTGIGAGIMAEGLIIHGQSDLAGAVGWMALTREFKPEYARCGCFEWEASGGAFARKAAELMASCPEFFPVEKSRPITPAEAVTELCQAARNGLPQAVELVEEIQDYLAMGVANLVSTLNPEVIVFGGGLFQSPDLFFKTLREKFKRWAQPLAARQVRLKLSALGQEAALYGCARAAWMMIDEHGGCCKKEHH
ncbi:MAG: ROK family protein [Candidatus Saccharicenans sp.]|nr:ROK family protein [Candidatus Saccharicenans sp.]